MINMTRDASQVAEEAIANTQAQYWDKLCAMRSGTSPMCEGSRYPRYTPSMVDKYIRALVWEFYTHEAVKAPAVALIARAAYGELGVTRLADVPDGEQLRFSDPKGTGKVECTWVAPPPKARPRVEHTVLLVGPRLMGADGNTGDGKLIVYTFFPGDPIEPSKVERIHEMPAAGFMQGTPPKRDLHDKLVSKREAFDLGVEWVKFGADK